MAKKEWYERIVGNQKDQRFWRLKGEEKPFGYETEIILHMPTSAFTSTGKYVVRLDKDNHLVKRKEFKTEQKAMEFIEGLKLGILGAYEIKKRLTT